MAEFLGNEWVNNPDIKDISCIMSHPNGPGQPSTFIIEHAGEARPQVTLPAEPEPLTIAESRAAHMAKDGHADPPAKEPL